MYQNLLVTGGAGFIGSNFIKYSFKHFPGIKITNLDKLTYAGSLENLKDLSANAGYEFVQGDVCDSELVTDLMRDKAIDCVVHFAAETHVDRSIVGPAAFINTNIIGTFTMLEAARKVWLDENHSGIGQVRFHHISTDEVYGTLSPDDPAFEETTPYAPNSPYAASKASADMLVCSYNQTYGLPVTITNCSNNYGPNQFPEKLIPLVILNATNGKDLPIYGDGRQIRDWLYVDDHNEAIWKVIVSGLDGESYNIGGNNQPTTVEIVDMICEILDELTPASAYKPHAQLKKHVTDRPGHDRRYAMNIDKIQNELGWSPKLDLREGLQQTVRWYLEHPEWVQKILDQKQFNEWVAKNYTNRD